MSRSMMLVPLLAACTLPAQTRTPNPGAVETITAGDVARRIGIIAHDSMLGRDTPSRGLELTAHYAADQFRSFGLRPGGDNGSWFQRYPLDQGVPPDSVPPATAPNVVAILHGRDSALRHEYLVYSAHMDHIGITPGRADSINNGADDDGSGTAGVIELAEAFGRPGARPRRSIIFLLVSGEEKGLWGSRHFTAHPPVPIGQIVANINLDMIGRNWRDTVVAIGREHSDLGVTLDRVVRAHPELRMTAIDDPWPEERFFYRSDHYNFARRGVPALFFFSGVHQDYHEVTDSPDKIDSEKEARILRLLYYLGEEVGNTARRPQWDPKSYREIVIPRLSPVRGPRAPAVPSSRSGSAEPRQ